MQQQDNDRRKRSVKELIDNEGHPVFFTPLDASRRMRLEFKRSDLVVLSGSLGTRDVGKKARVRIGSVMYDVYRCACELPDCQAYIKLAQVLEEAA